MRLVLVRLSALGDIVHTWPLVCTLRQTIPQLHITWVVEDSLRSLVEGHPAVDCTMTTATRRWRRAPFSQQTRAETAVLRTRLRELSPDIALDPQGTLKSAWITHLSGAADRVGLARPWRRELAARLAYTRTVAGSRRNPHVVATNMAMAWAFGVDPGEIAPPDGRWLLQHGTDRPSDPTQKAPFCLLLPGAGQPTKVISTEVLGETARGLAKRHLHVVVAWGPGEKQRAEDVVLASGDAATLAPATNLVELAHLSARAALVIGGDTGPTHLAASLGVATLGVFVDLSPVVRPSQAKARRPGCPSSRQILRSCDELLKT